MHCSRSLAEFISLLSFRLLGLTLAAFAINPICSVEASIVGPGIYTLGDHPDGNISTSAGPYGLRADFLPGSPGPTFSLEQGGAQMSLVWDGGATALISGVLHHNALNELWSVSFEITGVSVVGGANGGFEATGGAGTLWTNSTMDSLTSYSLLAKQDGSGISHRFLGDGHRLTGDTESQVGRGWIDRPGTNDFLFTVTEFAHMPEPGSLVVWSLSGLLFVAGSRRRRRRTR